tara:strand:+ start:9077 stop:9604 length:528 start_codon:yes stop_codon:yes gene_type:complete
MTAQIAPQSATGQSQHGQNQNAKNQTEPEIDAATAARKYWMSILARTDCNTLATHWQGNYADVAWQTLRAPQIGMVMVRGRAGGAGQRFNLGEMTVTRCSVTLADGTIGHAYVKGRDRTQAEYAALFDAVMLRDGAAQSFIDDLAQKQAVVKRDHARKIAATKVDFFTLVRGEDE